MSSLKVEILEHLKLLTETGWKVSNKGKTCICGDGFHIFCYHHDGCPCLPHSEDLNKLTKELYSTL